MTVINPRKTGILHEHRIWLDKTMEQTHQEILKVTGTAHPHKPRHPLPQQHNQHFHRHLHHPHPSHYPRPHYQQPTHHYPPHHRRPFNQRRPPPHSPPPPHMTTTPPTHHVLQQIRNSPPSTSHPPPAPPQQQPTPPPTALTVDEIQQLRHLLRPSPPTSTASHAQAPPSINHPATTQLAWALGMHPTVQGLPQL